VVDRPDGSLLRGLETYDSNHLLNPARVRRGDTLLTLVEWGDAQPPMVAMARR
jgi:hypothetical protein